MYISEIHCSMEAAYAHMGQDDMSGAVQTFISCSKYMGTPGMIHACTPDYHILCFLGMDDLTTEPSFATWVIDMFNIFF